MKRRALLKNALHLGLIAHPVSRLVGNSFIQQKEWLITAGLRKPVTIYNNWSAYDELSDNIPLIPRFRCRLYVQQQNPEF